MEWVRINEINWVGAPDEIWTKGGLFLVRYYCEPLWRLCTDLTIIPERCTIAKVYLDEYPPFTWADEKTKMFIRRKKKEFNDTALYVM